MSSVTARESSQASMVLLGVLGVLLMMGVWELVGRLELLGRNWQPLSAVVRAFLDNPPVFGRATRATTIDAGKGFVAGILLGLALAVLGLLAPALNRGIGRMATLVNSIPWIALGPVLVMVVSQETVPFTFALLAVFFASFIAITSGFYLARQAHHDLLTSLGSSRWTRFLRLQLPVAVGARTVATISCSPEIMSSGRARAKLRLPSGDIVRLLTWSRSARKPPTLRASRYPWGKSSRSASTVEWVGRTGPSRTVPSSSSTWKASSTSSLGTRQ